MLFNGGVTKKVKKALLRSDVADTGKFAITVPIIIKADHVYER